jgi:hypothetical protein
MGLVMIEQNKAIYNIINKRTLKKTLANMSVDSSAKIKPDATTQPLWITGLFRSGTSITTSVISSLGGDLGPDNHLLQAKGARKKLNPDGFFENYLFMDLSMFIMHKLGSWGDNPPSEQSIATADFNAIDHKEFCEFSLVGVHDDRISNRDKSQVLQHFSANTLDEYLRTQFTGMPVIKNPHFCLMPELLNQYWPTGAFLVVFRDPESTLKSAEKVTPRANLELYNAYYERMLKVPNAIFFCYEDFLVNPTFSISTLKHAFGFEGDTEKAAALVKGYGLRSGTSHELYRAMHKMAINRKP